MIQVLGHINPDSDAICTAVVTAHWLTSCHRPAQAWRLGEANQETRFIFDYAGLALPDVLNIPLKDEAVWLVGFSEPAQGPADLYQSRIVGILDHHPPGGTIAEWVPEAWIRPLGSAATMQWLLIDATVPQALTANYATLLLGALLSETLNLHTSTTTEDDLRAATRLAQLSGVNLTTFSRDLFYARTDHADLTASCLLANNLKVFAIAGMDVHIARLELSSLNQIDSRLNDLHAAIRLHAKQTDADLVVLMLTDIREGFSVLYFAGREGIRMTSCSVPGMVSRTKQLLPWLASRLTLKRSCL
ncbi:inorganic pyrophosphatase [Erwinia sp. OLTSP20]|uniref:DHHA2 domain-containing protein n=1 Tax=unclassified Erwinia TaxID=2622719 RepID=UPI000C68F9A3|nr:MULTISPECIES: DHHA2 domain-containing protein [unclassified Erwinia]PIJ49640.1 inorganic pyrophosphatase [Erwinia sp. OAMSP11]PIJ70055.1 inorganic pyrophosphatase [Erwinia sp. OLSSP12]PIJ80552.1 inorganic pyrophosphatase [Erwinia sp. OLCASP19]PIJ82717.1 inorganic pyrophosphatase [Erwinia sp. OLMTSP26]PIJ84839.1 inorganic pyrophosphatase [Erwinia sp. OLMDSP33]